MENSKIKIEDIVNSTTIEKLKEKGLDEVFVQEKIKMFSELAAKVGADPIKFVKVRLQSYFNRFLLSASSVIKATVLGVKSPRDLCEFQRKWANRNLGVKRKNGYIVKANCFSWDNGGFKQGMEIPEGVEKWESQGTLLVEYKDKLFVKEYTVNCKDKDSIPEVKPLDIVTFKVNPEKLEGTNGIFISNLTTVGKLNDDQITALLPNLTQYVKTSEQLYNMDYNGFVIMKGDISIIENNGFDIIDFEELDTSKVVGAYMQDINFVEGAMGITFLGNTYKNKNTGQYTLSVYHAIVPEEFKPVTMDTEQVAAVENQANDMFKDKTDDIISGNNDEDIL